MYGAKEKEKSEKARGDKLSDYKHKVEIDSYSSCWHEHKGTVHRYRVEYCNFKWKENVSLVKILM